MTTTAEAMRAHRGPALFSYGFRPFFLGGAVWAAVAVPIWIASLMIGDGRIGGLDGLTWHRHEMLFGFVPAIMAGFLLTAVPNWTGRLPVTGRPLALLAALWLAGRLAMLAFGGHPLAAIVDSAFLVVFAGFIWREVLAGRSRKNLPVCLLASGLALANILSHLSAVLHLADGAPERAALAVIAALLALIGGRITPSFTRNWLLTNNPGPQPAAFGRIDQAALAATVAGLAGWVAFPASSAAGAPLLAAGLLTILRLARWKGWRAVSEPLVWSLHLGGLWLAAGLCLAGLAAMAPSWAPRTAGVHALTAGAIGVMVLAVMTRASLGHTGRARRADRTTTALYLAANAAALVRVAAPFAGEAQPLLLVVSASLWTAAFGGFALAYGPMLLTPRR